MRKAQFWISCRDAIELIDSPESLHARSRLGLLLHLVLCQACRIYRAQLGALKRACRLFHNERAPSAEAVRALEDRVLKTLEKESE